MRMPPEEGVRVGEKEVRPERAARVQAARLAAARSAGTWRAPAIGRILGSRLSALGSRLSALGSRLSALGSRLSALGSRLSALGSRLSALGSRLSALGSRALGSRLSALGSRLSALGSRLSALGSRLSALGSRLSALGSRLSALGSRLSALGSRLSALGSLTYGAPLRARLGPGTAGEPGACAPGGLRLRKGSERGLQLFHGLLSLPVSSAHPVDRLQGPRPASRHLRRSPGGGSRSLSRACVAAIAACAQIGYATYKILCEMGVNYRPKKIWIQ